jgi:hypothetical protein
VVGGLGLFHRGGAQDEQPVIGIDPAGSLEEHPVVLSGSLQQAIASLQARLQQVPQDADPRRRARCGVP